MEFQDLALLCVENMIYLIKRQERNIHKTKYCVLSIRWYN